MLSGSLTGDLDALTRFGDRVGAFGNNATMRGLSAELGDESIKLIEKGFALEQDPYGIPWFRKHYPDGRKTLQGATGKLAKSFKVRYVGPDGVIVASSLKRSNFQQSGTGIYGPSKSIIRPKNGKYLRFTAANGSTLFRRSVKGQEQRRMVPLKTIASPMWNRALKARGIAFFKSRLSQAA